MYMYCNHVPRGKHLRCPNWGSYLDRAKGHSLASHSIEEMEQNDIGGARRSSRGP